ncbi:hypothetical protein Tco_0705347 [Tanacetum coccineum]|uniref:Uncharacterized protein n=1 Tax=Tanacetum coccineum TaxID=301880 RepID=A0ABQ4Y4H8_9ASTR
MASRPLQLKTGKSFLNFRDIGYFRSLSFGLVRCYSVMSDSDESGVTYTEISSTFEELLDIGSPGVVPFKDYIPGARGATFTPQSIMFHEPINLEFMPQESDPEADPEEDDKDPEEDPVDYPADGGDDGDDEEGSSEDDEDDDMDIEADDDDEEEEHPAVLSNSCSCSTAADRPIAGIEIEPFETMSLQATPFHTCHIRGDG